MVWLPDHVWEAQRSSKGSGKGGGMKGGGGVDMNELSRLVAQQLIGQGLGGLIGGGGGGYGGGGGGGGWSAKVKVEKTKNAGKGGGKGGKFAAAVAQNKAVLEVPFKSLLMNGLQKKERGLVLQKGLFQYETVEIEGGYVSTLTSEKLEGVYSTSTAAASRKQAEENCAMQAVQAEFPAEFGKASKSVKAAARNLSATPSPKAKSSPKAEKQAKAKAKGQAPQANKVKAEPVLMPKGTSNGSGGEDPNSKLAHIVAVLKGEPPIKTDMVFSLQDVGEKMQATVKITLPTGSHTYAGKVVPGISKESGKQAKFNAAQQAIKGLDAKYQAKLPEYEAKKAAKAEEWEAKKAARTS